MGSNRPGRDRNDSANGFERTFDSLKAKKLSRGGAERGDGGEGKGGNAGRIGSQSGGEEGGRWGRQGARATGGKRLHYVRDRAKLLGIWIIEAELSHLCLQSSRYFKRSCTPDRTAHSRRVKAPRVKRAPRKTSGRVLFEFLDPFACQTGSNPNPQFCPL